ncbi:glycoside hydrolase family protein [Neorhodopirellula lusitana]|uniref:glycoside hydrolase family 10 n=1 Tax=Neorhodopirellula lusitana TaxID=445327 RepID=UPI00384AAE49
MGQMHFYVPDAAADFFHQCHWQEAYLCGIEGVPWQSRNIFHPSNDPSVLPTEEHADQAEAEGGGVLTLNRAVDTSAKLLLTCPVEGIGFRVLTTCSLRCVETPHNLLVELARGSCHRVRIQADTWQRGGLTLSEKFNQLIGQGVTAFLDAIQPTNSALKPETPEFEAEVTQSAIQAIALLEQAASELGELFATQSMAFRRTREPRLSTMMAVGVCPASRAETASAANPDDTIGGLSAEESVVPGFGEDGIGQAFNAAAVRISWGDIENDSGSNDFGPVTRVLEACEQSGTRVIGGPIIDHRDGLLPDWLTLLGDDFEQLMSAMTQFVEATVNQFRGRVHLWNAAAGLNIVGPLSLDDEQIMRFSIGILQTIRRCDPNTPVIMSIDQPCGEYLARHANGISPIHFADALLRSGLGLAGIGLNFRFGYSKGQTHPRSPVEFAQLIDRWATLNSPLLVQLSVPAAPGEDADARMKVSPVALSPGMNGTLDCEHQSKAWADQQYAFARPLVQTLLAKQIVHAVVWDGWSDQLPHLSPHSGVIDGAGNARPILRYLTELREEVLM